MRLVGFDYEYGRHVDLVVSLEGVFLIWEGVAVHLCVFGEPYVLSGRVTLKSKSK